MTPTPPTAYTCLVCERTYWSRSQAAQHETKANRDLGPDDIHHACLSPDGARPQVRVRIIPERGPDGRRVGTSRPDQGEASARAAEARAAAYCRPKTPGDAPAGWRCNRCPLKARSRSVAMQHAKAFQGHKVYPADGVKPADKPTGREIRERASAIRHGDPLPGEAKVRVPAAYRKPAKASKAAPKAAPAEPDVYPLEPEA